MISLDIASLLKNHWPKLLGILGVAFICLQFWQLRQMEHHADMARIEAQNALAEMSRVVQENNDTWSRLAQERSDLIGELNSRNSELADIIRDRNEEIQTLTNAVASIAAIRVIVRPENGGVITETTEEIDGTERIRVEFDQLHEEFIRVSGHTLSNPPEAEIGLEFVRPVNFTLAVTQLEDLSWRSYITTDFPGMTIGEIETLVSPLARPADVRRWEQDLEFGVYGNAAVTGNFGSFGVDVGYDFGPIDISVDLGGTTYSGTTDFTVGGRVGFAPFDF